MDDYLRRLDKWLSEQVTEERKQEAKWLYSVYMKLAERKQDEREGDLARALKQAKLQEKPPQDLHAELKAFDLIQSFIAQGKETADFHKQVSGFLEGLQGRLDAPLEKFPQIVPELSNIIQEIGKLLTASDAVQSRNLQTVEGLRGVLEAVKWELSGKSIDKRAIPQWDKGNTSRIMNESTREVMAGMRWSRFYLKKNDENVNELQLFGWPLHSTDLTRGFFNGQQTRWSCSQVIVSVPRLPHRRDPVYQPAVQQRDEGLWSSWDLLLHFLLQCWCWWFTIC